jgi:AcrR family transcriptional regulator
MRRHGISKVGPHMEPTEFRTINLAEAMTGRDRRAKIVTALYRCMVKKGYAATTLCDIAEEAGMTSSHLLYYYPGKEAILEAFFKAVTKGIEREIAQLEDSDPAEKLEAIADLFLSPHGLRKSDQGVMLDLYAQAVQNKAMRRVKVAHDRRVKDMFVKLFSQLHSSPETVPEDAAQMAYAMLLGLRANSFYDPQLSTAQANRLFKQALLRIAGLKAEPRARSLKPSHSAAL